MYFKYITFLLGKCSYFLLVACSPAKYVLKEYFNYFKL